MNMNENCSTARKNGIERPRTATAAANVDEVNNLILIQ